MTENEITVADLLQQLRAWLNAQGDVGAWLLAAIDDTVDSAYEFDVALAEPTADETDSVEAEATTDDVDLFGARVRTHGQRQRRTQAGRTTKVTGIAFRPPSDPTESLRLHLQILTAYLVIMPRCIASARAALREDFGVEEAAFVLLGEMAVGALGRAQDYFHFDDLTRGADPEKAAELINSALEALDRQANP